MKVAGTDVQCQSEPIHTGRTVNLDHYPFVAKRVPASEQPRVREFLSELLALSPRSTQNSEPASPALAAARLDPQLMGDQIRRAVLDLLEGECRQQPVVWILEDLQWGDQPTVRLIDLALRQLSEKPFFVV